jgi:predicted AAA+ superfamily ATPase
MIPRTDYVKRVHEALRRNPVAAIIGPRQCGKTTLARQVASQGQHVWFDLEDSVDVRRLEQPRMVLSQLSGLIVIDEIQRMPELFPLLRVLVDGLGQRQKFLILGSASLGLVARTAESLAGRVEFVEMSGFDIGETGIDSSEKLWVRGSFPRSFLARSEVDSVAWRENFVRTFLERDLAVLEVGVTSVVMRRFWTMLAHYHGQVWNAAEIARAMGVTGKTVARYLDVLEATFMIRRLQPWFENVGKRLVKSPKIYIRDSGLLHRLLGIDDRHSLFGHPKVGASWEGFAMEQVLRYAEGEPFFWATHNGAEIDLVLTRREPPLGFEFKRADAPGATRSMHTALRELKLGHLYVVHPGNVEYPLAEKVTALPLPKLVEQLARRRGAPETERLN